MEYSIVRSKRRTLAVEITREGAVIVRAPRSCPQSSIDRLLLTRADWIEKHIQMQRARLAAHPEPDEAQRAALIEKAKAELPRRLEYYSEMMGLHPTGLKITSARTRFGSCSPTGGICFSWRLMAFPPAAVDYVVVHELAHLVYRNHGREFYTLIEKYLPDYKARKSLLRE